MTQVHSSAHHYRFLDGMRGLAAAFVVLHHTSYYLPVLPRLLTFGLGFLRMGHYAVAVFIVLSGYCLMLPIVKDGELRGGALGFLGRRAKRILPPYYAALAFSIFLYNVMGRSMTAGTVVSHVFMFHNLSAAWSRSLDAPLWSVASEWQIYFLLPFFFLPICKRFGMTVAASAGLLLGIIPLVTLPPASNFNWACPQYIGLFGLGMAAASAPRPSRLPWGTLAVAGMGLFCVFVVLGSLLKGQLIPQGMHITEAWPLDILIGAVTASVIIFCANAGSPSPCRRSVLLRLFSSRFAVGIGSFSYSLYLVHHPLLMLMVPWLRVYSHSTVIYSALLFGTVLPVVAGVAYLFYLVAERPFLAKRKTPNPLAPVQTAN